MPIMRDREALLGLSLAKLQVAGMVAEGYRYPEIAERTGYASATVKSIVSQLADRVAAAEGNAVPGVVVRDWWHSERVNVALEMLETIGVSVEELAAGAL